jgi:hypothetical protein
MMLLNCITLLRNVNGYRIFPLLPEVKIASMH